MTLRIETLTGEALDAALDDVARLRIAVFREWPYLYDGDLAYERAYLDVYRHSPGAMLVGAFNDDGVLVGAATGTPMTDHAKDFAAAFERTDLDLADIFYCAESVLLPEYRGLGAGHHFFDLREQHARNRGHRWCAFCAVSRPGDHSLRPAGYRPLDAFWRKRGYMPLKGVVAGLDWKDIDQPAETRKPLQFWIRQL